MTSDPMRVKRMEMVEDELPGSDTKMNERGGST